MKKQIKKTNKQNKIVKIVIISIISLLIIGLSTWVVLLTQDLNKANALIDEKTNKISVMQKEINDKQKMITSQANDIVALNVKIADKDYEIKRLGGVITDKDKTITSKNQAINTKDREITICNGASAVLANWGDRLITYNKNYNKYFIEFSDWVFKYAGLDNTDIAYLNDIVYRFNYNVQNVRKLLNEMDL